MSEIDVDRMARELLFGKFLNRLIVDYKDIKLSDGQLMPCTRIVMKTNSSE